MHACAHARGCKHTRSGPSTCVLLSTHAPFLHGVPCFCTPWHGGVYFCILQHCGSPFFHPTVRRYPFLCPEAWRQCPIFTPQDAAAAALFCTLRHGGGPFSCPKAQWRPLFAPCSRGTSTSEGVASRLLPTTKPRPTGWGPLF